MQFWQIFFKYLFIGMQHTKSHWRFGNCVCCWSLLCLEVPPLLLPCRRGISFHYSICSSPWVGEWSRPGGPHWGFFLPCWLAWAHSSIYATWTAYELLTAQTKASHLSLLVSVGISASCWKKTGHCHCMKTSKTAFFSKPSSVQKRSDCLDSHMARLGFCKHNGLGENN